MIVPGIQLDVIQPPAVLKSSFLSFNAQDTIGIFLGGCFVGFFVTYYSILYSKKISRNNPIPGTVAYSLVALLIVAGIGTLLNLSDASVYYLQYVLFNIPQYLILGLAIGLIIQKRHLVDTSSESTAEERIR